MHFSNSEISLLQRFSRSMLFLFKMMVLFYFIRFIVVPYKLPFQIRVWPDHYFQVRNITKTIYQSESCTIRLSGKNFSQQGLPILYKLHSFCTPRIHSMMLFPAPILSQNANLSEDKILWCSSHIRQLYQQFEDIFRYFQIYKPRTVQYLMD